MHIIHIASEIAPIAKIGGLGDVLLGLPREQSRLKNDVDLFLPKYDCMDTAPVRDLHILDSSVEVEWEGVKHKNTIWVGWLDSIKIYFIDPQHPKLFFNRGCIYGCDDDVDRFIYFSKAALETIKALQLKPQILHLHDWHTAAVALFCKEMYTVPAGLVYSIHNLQYQGLTQSIALEHAGLDPLKLKRFADDAQPELLNLMKTGILCSDKVTTVSCTYAREIQTEEHGMGLSKILAENGHKVRGIINGVDYNYWNPEKDPLLPAAYSPRIEPKDEKDRATLDRKGFVKKFLREKLALDEAHRPLVGVVARLVPQKGVHLIEHALYRTLEKHGQFVLLGTTQIPSINREFHDLMHKFAEHPHVRLTLKHEEELAHLIFGGADIFLVPSIFEPCGLTQLIAMKYGAIPVVRHTGGLADTVHDLDHPEGNGYVFQEPTPKGFNTAFDRAVEDWYERPAWWRETVERVMQLDYSWKKPALEYLELYGKVVP
ncbi:MAG: glycogen synthase [Chlamydiia bacterium]|nr:glycogen synthase [Chlamydiia bacterium]